MISITEATKEHLPQILEIGKEAISPSWTYDFLLDEYNNGDSYIYTAIDKSTEESFTHLISGFVIFRQVGDDSEILQIAVNNKERRKGIGNALIKVVIKKAKENGNNSIFLEVRSSNTPAVCLYEKHGFNTIRTRKNYYNDPTEDAIVMALSL